MTDVIGEKIARLRTGAKPRTLDLFAGCGGISLGFHKAGFETLAAVEIDEWAARSHARNFFPHLDPALRERHAQNRDITQLEPEELFRDLGYDTPAEHLVDVIVGGPPCQSFARVGRAKLREVADHPEAFRIDPRSNLYLRYLHYVKKLKPVALLMENVPDVLNHGGHNIAEETCEQLTELGYTARYTLLNAVNYGVPQMRERMFLMAYHQDLGLEVEFPEPTHWIELPRGYKSARQVALKYIKSAPFGGQFYYQDPPPHPETVIPAVTVEDAVGDLPPITLHLEGKLKRGTRRFDEVIPYDREPHTEFARWMRNWPSFDGGLGPVDHVIRSLPRDYEIFRKMNPGDQYPQAFQHAQAIFNEQLQEKADAGTPLMPQSPEYEALYRDTVPPYDPGKFPNKWRKMERDMPSRTLMAHLGKDCYSHIHYDSEQARTISVREAARLQSFPDGFRFEGTMNPAFRQIGNAVPPLLANALAVRMRTTLLNNFTTSTDKYRGYRQASGV